MESPDLKTQIIDWLDAQPLKPAKNTELTGESYFSVLAGVPNDFNEIRIHLAIYPETFRDMQYAESNIFSLMDFFDFDKSRQEKIHQLKDILKNISLTYSVPEASICIPYILIVENEGCEEEFYDTTKFPCSVSGTG